MGLFDFVKDAGDKLFGNDEAEAAEAQAKAQADAQAAQQAQKAANLARAKSLTSLLEGMDLGIDSLIVQVQGAQAIVHGKAPSQEAKEKAVLLVGNTQGIQQVDDQLVVEKPEPEATMYTVKSGDSLSKIAKAHYGDAGTYMKIFNANTPMLKDPNKIHPGQVLRIPPKA